MSNTQCPPRPFGSFPAFCRALLPTTKHSRFPVRYRSIMYSALRIALLLALVQLHNGRAEGLIWLDDDNVVWTHPSHDSSESMPCGGDIGANGWAESRYLPQTALRISPPRTSEPPLVFQSAGQPRPVRVAKHRMHSRRGLPVGRIREWKGRSGGAILSPRANNSAALHDEPHLSSASHGSFREKPITIVGVARGANRETPSTTNAPQTLANPWDNSPPLSASAKENPTVAKFRYRRVQVAGAG